MGDDLGGQSHPARVLEITEFRAAVVHTLKMPLPSGPGPDGLTILRLPSDREILDEIARLRQVVDRVGGWAG